MALPSLRPGGSGTLSCSNAPALFANAAAALAAAMPPPTFVRNPRRVILFSAKLVIALVPSVAKLPAATFRARFYSRIGAIGVRGMGPDPFDRRTVALSLPSSGQAGQKSWRLIGEPALCFEQLTRGSINEGLRLNEQWRVKSCELLEKTTLGAQEALKLWPLIPAPVLC